MALGRFPGMRCRSDGPIESSLEEFDHVKKDKLHIFLWCAAVAWAIVLLVLLAADGLEQNPALMILAAVELLIHLVWILLDRRCR